MAHMICSLRCPPPSGWGCVHCLEDHDGHDLVTHRDGLPQCLFHRMCYSVSKTGTTGICEVCDRELHPGNPALYISSRADTSRITELARCFRATKKAFQRDGTLLNGAAHKKMIRSASWSGQHKKPSQEDINFVREFLRPVIERHSRNRQQTNIVQDLCAEQDRIHEGWV